MNDCIRNLYITARQFMRVSIKTATALLQQQAGSG
jgi:hypothetical protein